MPAIKWRGALIAGLTLAAIVTPVAAQERELLTLDEALGRTGVVAEPANTELNPRIVGPRAEAEAAQALVGQARLRPNPEISLEVENIAGSGAFSGLSATEYTLAVGQRLELGGKRGTRVEAARAQAQLADLRADLAGAELGFLVRERYVAAAAAASRVELALDVVERNEELARIAGLLVEVAPAPCSSGRSGLGGSASRTSGRRSDKSCSPNGPRLAMGRSGGAAACSEQVPRDRTARCCNGDSKRSAIASGACGKHRRRRRDRS